jgi:hypothetical protein
MLPDRSMHTTERFCVPPPQGAEQGVHAPATQAYASQGRSKQLSSVAGGGPRTSQLPAGGLATDTGDWMAVFAVQSSTGLKLPWRKGGGQAAEDLSCLPKSVIEFSNFKGRYAVWRCVPRSAIQATG